VNATTITNYPKPIGVKCTTQGCKANLNSKNNVIRVKVTVKKPPTPVLTSICIDDEEEIDIHEDDDDY
jgi:hypothetical protein